MKITKRDVKFFLLGLLTFFLIDTLTNWEESKESFKQGFKDGYNDTYKDKKKAEPKTK